MDNTNNIKLSNGFIVPPVGFGSSVRELKKPMDEIIKDAVDAGFRYFDTASFYCSERDVGKALRNCGLKREEYYVATKCWWEELGYENAKEACYQSLERLGLDYVDLYLIHWPKKSPDAKDWKETIIDTWRALIELKNEGKVRAIGVSNFLPHHLQVIFDNFDERPVVDQLELHMGYFQEYAVRFLQANNIQAQAWSPLGRGMKDFVENKILSDMANKYNVSIQKLGLRFLSQRGIMPIVWSTSKEHMIENLNIFDFTINDEDISVLSCMPQENWLGEHPDFYMPLTKHVNKNQ